jgi:hypothetical protein
MNNKFALVATAAIGVGAALAFAMPASAGVNLQSESPGVGVLDLGKRARLDANGAVVFAPVTVACAPGTTAYLTVKVTQAIGDSIASGQKSRSVSPCNGQKKKVELSITPTQRPFRTGVAYGEAELSVCNYYTCTTLYDEHLVTITR